MEPDIEEIKLKKPITYKGNKIYCFADIREMLECDVIDITEYDQLIERLKLGDKVRRKYKELYQDAETCRIRLLRENNELWQALDELNLTHKVRGYLQLKKENKIMDFRAKFND